MFNIAEANTNIKGERIKHDAAIIKRILSSVCNDAVDGSEIIEIKRIGKKTDQSTRPVIVKLKNQASKRMVLLNANKLQECGEDSLNTVRMSHDLTLQEREHSKQLYIEAKRRESENPSGGFKYKVRGPPWDMRIVKIKINQ